MRILDEQDQEVEDPDLTLGHLVKDKLFIAHHDEIPEQLPVTKIDTDNPYYVGSNGGKLVKTVVVSEYQPRVPAWDEYEDIYRYVLYTQEELSEIEAQKKPEEEARAEAEAQAKAEEEARKAQERMDAAVKSFALLAMPMMTLDSVNDAGVASLVPLYPDWDPNGHEYYKGDPFIYENRYFRASQDITSSSVYKPGDPGTESLYYEFFIADDGVVIFHEVKGDYNAFNKGDLCHYPDADDPIYESIIDGNSWSPDAYPAGWKLVS